ncbi:MAG: chromosome segregation protein SMC [Steroidobacteraceae bacterium]
MRLTKIKLAGFKSFVDPTQVTFPSNLTGVVGPNGCGKSNVIDAVRWVMGELSAKHLRGDNMADVIFNGSSARKPVGTASVELVFDNSDGKIGGAYASYNEIALKRQVSRDGSSGYYINGARCRRKDITNLFLGTGLGSRSYAIIEQGTISRIIEAKAEDMRAFVEEAAGISRYKERRRETESRIAETRENLERLQDVREEIEKQIRHLQRQAATARRYQGLKEQERRTLAELLALRMRELDSGAQVHDAATRERELEMHSALADQRAAEAAIERARERHGSASEQLSAVQGRHFELGADISRLEQSIQHSRQMRERQRADLEQARASLAELAAHIEREEHGLAAVRAELEQSAPALQDAQRAEQAAAEGLEASEQELSAWQERWEQLNQALGAADRTAQVERARIEQLDNQLRRLATQHERLALEREALQAHESNEQLALLEEQESEARSAREELGERLRDALERVQRSRSAQLQAEQALQSARQGRERSREECTSLEAVQKAALSSSAGQVRQWLGEAGLAGRERLAERIEVESGWERAVETALGDYLEAVCVEALEALAAPLQSLREGRVMLVQEAGAAAAAEACGPSLAQKVSGSASARAALAGVRTAESLSDALRLRASLGPGESIITRNGEWVGREWLRVSRGVDPHAGIIEREHRLKTLRAAAAEAEERVRLAEAHLGSVRESLATAESERDGAQAQIHAAQRRHAELAGALQAARARAEQARARRARIEEESEELAREMQTAREALTVARDSLEASVERLAQFNGAREGLEEEREVRREALAAARARAQAAQLAARDLLVRIESRRSAQSAAVTSLARMAEQRMQLERRRTELETELAGGDGPVLELEARLNETLAQRIAVERELATARGELEEQDIVLRTLEQQRSEAERRVGHAREAMEAARLAAQENRVRRETLFEQFNATRFELPEVLQSLAPEASVPLWEENLAQLREGIEKLGQVNLAAIDELAEQTERKEYLDRQFADLTSALETLEEAMRRIDKETRTRFEETFEKINSGMKEKFPRLFGGGHAYLELVGDDVLNAGVSVMARPPGKKNSSIHLLSGGEKALTAVALVFSIFDLNPAPFCLLDEVDAPLDEANVGRFCDIVREMSERVQFIFITHNKTTMELAAQLLGVTMHEPGVSRLVAVDVDEAVRLAAV